MTARPGPVPWSVAEGMAPLLLMVAVGMVGLGLSGQGSAPSLGGSLASTAAGGLVGSAAGLALAVRRGGLATLGLRPARPGALLLAVAGVPAFGLVATGWTALVEALGGAPPVQFLVQEVAADPEAPVARLVLAWGVLGAPLVEELLFRGLLLPPLVARFGAPAGIALNALAFGLLHVADPWTVPVLVLFGAALAALRRASGSLLPPLLLHAGNNLLSLGLLLYG